MKVTPGGRNVLRYLNRPTTLRIALAVGGTLVLAAWCRSYFRADSLMLPVWHEFPADGRDPVGHTTEFLSAVGKTELFHVTFRDRRYAYQTGHFFYHQPTRLQRVIVHYPGGINTMKYVNFLGCALAYGTDLGDRCETRFQLIAPYWAIVALLWIWPTFAVIQRYRSGKLRRPGFCSKCGYDLRGTPDRCPECGSKLPMSIRIGTDVENGRVETENSKGPENSRTIQTG